MSALVEYMDQFESFTYCDRPHYAEITMRFRKEDGLHFHYAMIEALKTVLEKRREVIGQEEAMPL